VQVIVPLAEHNCDGSREGIPCTRVPIDVACADVTGHLEPTHSCARRARSTRLSQQNTRICGASRAAASSVADADTQLRRRLRHAGGVPLHRQATVRAQVTASARSAAPASALLASSQGDTGLCDMACHITGPRPLSQEDAADAQRAVPLTS
jgi:hypothetical protein